MKRNQRKWLADVAVILLTMAAVTALGIMTSGLL